MAKAHYLERYSLIYNKLINEKQSMAQLHNFLKNNSASHKVSKRTLVRDIEAVQEHYGVIIKYNRKENYYELEDYSADADKIRSIEAFELYNALQYSSKIGNKIILENRNRTGIEYIHGLLHTIENNLEIEFIHQSYWNADPPKVPVQAVKVKVQPIAIKEAQHRWYLIGFDVAKFEYRSFGLDRISNLKILDQKFRPKKFDPIAYYQHAFGIETSNIPEKIVLQFTSKQALYIKALPIHHSQKVISENNDFCLFEYFMHPAFALEMEILKYGDSVQVLEPLSLVTETKKRIANASKLIQ
jgi:proteasome accessory factor B